MADESGALPARKLLPSRLSKLRSKDPVVESLTQLIESPTGQGGTKDRLQVQVAALAHLLRALDRAQSSSASSAATAEAAATALKAVVPLVRLRDSFDALLGRDDPIARLEALQVPFLTDATAATSIAIKNALFLLQARRSDRPSWRQLLDAVHVVEVSGSDVGVHEFAHTINSFIDEHHDLLCQAREEACAPPKLMAKVAAVAPSASLTSSSIRISHAELTASIERLLSAVADSLAPSLMLNVMSTTLPLVLDSSHTSPPLVALRRIFGALLARDDFITRMEARLAMQLPPATIDQMATRSSNRSDGARLRDLFEVLEIATERASINTPATPPRHDELAKKLVTFVTTHQVLFVQACLPPPEPKPQQDQTPGGVFALVDHSSSPSPSSSVIASSSSAAADNAQLDDPHASVAPFGDRSSSAQRFTRTQVAAISFTSALLSAAATVLVCARVWKAGGANFAWVRR